MNTPHRLEQIVDGLYNMFSKLVIERDLNDKSIVIRDPRNEGYSIGVELLLKTYHNWSELQILSRRLRCPVFPTLMLSFGAGGSRVAGGTQAQFASLGETEDRVPFTLIALLKKKDSARDVTTDLDDELTDQTSDIIYSVERLVNGAHNLDGIDGVQQVYIEDIPETSEGRAAAISGTGLEVIVFKIIVVHVYKSVNFV